jgi:ubiquitin-like-conjugating enzyme ATG3
MQSLFHGVREYLTPVLTESAFEEKGILTPEEFVQAGDLLVYKCPTWRWESGDPALRRAYLPADKQFLVTRNVPCRRRVTALEQNYQSEQPVDGEDEWVAAQSYALQDGAGSGAARGLDGDAIDNISLDHISLEAAPPTTSGGILDAIVDNYAGDDGAAPDLSLYEEDNLVEDDAANTTGYLVASEPDDGDDDAILYTRTYDLSITYDKYYQTPRVWLFGYDEKNVPLSQAAMFEDIMQDYANRTVTMESHPHKTGLLHASIHPCQHGAVMKRILANLRGQDETATNQIRCDQYLFLFLKFIQSVVPTIDYDHTIEVNAKK